MFTALLVVVGLILIGGATMSFFLGKRMNAARLDDLTGAIKDYTNRFRDIKVTKDHKDRLYFSDHFAEEVGITNLVFIAGGKGGFLARWKNGRHSHFVPRDEEDCHAILRFIESLKYGVPELRAQIDKAAGAKDIEVEAQAEAAKDKETNADTETE